MALLPPTNGTLLGMTISPPTISLSWLGGGAAPNHYDLYRSTSSLLIGSKINVNPIPNPSPNNIVSVTDDGISTTSAPAVGTPLYYRLVAADINGNYGLISDAVSVTLESTEFVQDPILVTLISALRADQTLLSMVGNDPQQIRFHKRIRETGDVYPFIVIWRDRWDEDPKFKDLRYGTMTYKISVVHNAPSSQVVVNVLNRVCALLDGESGKQIFNGSPSIMVFMSMFTGAGPESFADNIKLWFQDGILKLKCQLFST